MSSPRWGWVLEAGQEVDLRREPGPEQSVLELQAVGCSLCMLG